MERSGLGSCPVVGFDISGVEPPGCATTVLEINLNSSPFREHSVTRKKKTQFCEEEMHLQIKCDWCILAHESEQKRICPWA
jgi:hypothetical protein